MGYIWGENKFSVSSVSAAVWTRLETYSAHPVVSPVTVTGTFKLSDHVFCASLKHLKQQSRWDEILSEKNDTWYFMRVTVRHVSSSNNMWIWLLNQFVRHLLATLIWFAHRVAAGDVWLHAAGWAGPALRGAGCAGVCWHVEEKWAFTGQPGTLLYYYYKLVMIYNLKFPWWCTAKVKCSCLFSPV